MPISVRVTRFLSVLELRFQGKITNKPFARNQSTGFRAAPGKLVSAKATGSPKMI